MKTLKKIIDCLECIIKKNFFNKSKTDFSHDCDKMLGLNYPDENDKKITEEYVTVYKSTTRWQTV